MLAELGGASAYVGGTTGGAANAQTLSYLSPQGYALQPGAPLVCVAGFSNSAAATLNVLGTGAKNIFRNTVGGPVALVGGEIVAGSVCLFVYDGTRYELLNPASVTTGPLTATDGHLAVFDGASGQILKDGGAPGGSNLIGYIAGLTLSNDGGTPNTIIDIASGICADASGVLMSLGAFTKTTAAWALGTGNGGLDTGAVASSTWYHVYVIQRSDTSAVDVLLSTSATAPTMPTNFDRKRRIGSFKTDGSSHIIAFTQVEETFFWGASVLDVSVGSTPVNTGTLVALSTPLGVKTIALCSPTANGSDTITFTSPDQPNEAVSLSAAPLGGFVSSFGGTPFQAYTNTSSQIRYRARIGGGALLIATLGWVDHRGRFG